MSTEARRIAADVSGINDPLCRHCGQKPRCRHGKEHRYRLCWWCLQLPGVKELYPFVDDVELGAVPEMTDAGPGTPEKLAVMERRAARGEQMFHPEDAKR